MLPAGEFRADTRARKGEERDEQHSAIPVTDQRFSPPMPALGGIFTPDTGPSRASRAWRALRCG
jgi:hypothetical protein